MTTRSPNEQAAAPLKGRGTASRIESRFDTWVRERDVVDAPFGTEDESVPPPATVVMRHHAKSILMRNDSPDIPFEQSINPYMGCEHGCIYCYARPSHGHLGLSPGIDFETRLFAKDNAAEVLRRELSKPRYVCRPVTLGGNTDPYQPIERKRRITRALIEVLADHGHPFSIITKNALIERDLDLLAPLAARNLVHAYVSVTQLDVELSRRLEPRASAPDRRIEAIRRLAQAGVPVGVMVAPIIPFVTDAFLEEILERAAAAGARSAGYVLLRLPHEILPLFEGWLETHVPLKAKHVMSLIRQMHGGKAYDARWGVRQRGTGPFAELLAQRFTKTVNRLGLNRPKAPLDTTQFRAPTDDPRQGSLL